MEGVVCLQLVEQLWKPKPKPVVAELDRKVDCDHDDRHSGTHIVLIVDMIDTKYLELFAFATALLKFSATLLKFAVIFCNMAIW